MTEENVTKTAKEEDDTINLVEIFRILRARILFIVLFLIIGAVAGFVVATVTYRPEYRSEAVFMVDSSSETAATPRPISTTQRTWSPTS